MVHCLARVALATVQGHLANGRPWQPLYIRSNAFENDSHLQGGQYAPVFLRMILIFIC
jgi:hypothetical protein